MNQLPIPLKHPESRRERCQAAWLHSARTCKGAQSFGIARFLGRRLGSAALYAGAGLERSTSLRFRYQ